MARSLTQNNDNFKFSEQETGFAVEIEARKCEGKYSNSILKIYILNIQIACRVIPTVADKQIVIYLNEAFCPWSAASN
jgi:hypothetical protein